MDTYQTQTPYIPRKEQLDPKISKLLKDSALDINWTQEHADRVFQKILDSIKKEENERH